MVSGDFMDKRLTPATIFLLIVPPLLWAGNAVVGRAVSDLIPPVTLNFLRWSLALLILLPLGRSVFVRGSGLLRHWRRYALLGLLGVGLYNGLQYMALHTSGPVNVTLVGASMPIWMLLIGVLFFRASVSRAQLLGALLSIAGVLVVLAHGDWRQLLDMRFVIGDLFMVVATVIWGFYSWLLTDHGGSPTVRACWATFLLAQVFYGVVWSGLFAGIEWAVSEWTIHWNGLLIASLLYVAIGPALIAFRCWGAGVQRVGPGIAGLFFNLTPIFAALLSSILLGESPHPYHAFAFALIVGGIVLSASASGD